MRFLSCFSKYSQTPRGTDCERLGGSWRRVLYMLPTQAIEYRLMVPPASPVFDFGVGTLLDDAPVRFVVVMADGDGESELFNAVVHSAAACDDGVLFLNAISQATKTRPSIPTLMTSLVPTATGVWNFAHTLDDAYHEAGPGVTPVKHDEQFDPGWIDRPTAEGRSLRYDREIRHNDSLLPRLLEVLTEMGLRENTLVILTSDHGEFLGENGLWGHHPPGQRQVIHVPLMLAYPARFHGGVRIRQNVQLIDVLPTVLELSQIDRSRLLMQGESLVDLIEGRRLPYWNDRATLSEEPLTFTGGNATASGSFLFRDWHLISSRTYGLHPSARNPARTDENRKILRAFNFREDPDESRPLEVTPPTLAAACWQAMRKLQANNIGAARKWTARRGEATHRYAPEKVERLRELGYMR